MMDPSRGRRSACQPRLWHGAMALALTVLIAWPASAQPAAAPEHECDRLAQPPRQALGRLPALAEGVSYESLRGNAARTACTRAMAEAPDEMRFVAYAARAADKAGDPREAARLYRIAAEAGNPVAQNTLGAMFEAGEGALPRNPREAARLYRLAADQEYPAAQANLAALYAFGRGGLARDDREAVRLWQRAAEREDPGAQTNLGTMYATGRGGLPRDNREAARMWRLAAEQGSTEAKNNLRKMGVR